MSFEGYTQYICANGHAFSQDVYATYGDTPVFCKCGASVVWENMVDQTNECFDVAHHFSGDNEYSNDDLSYVSSCPVLEEEKKYCRKHGCGYVELKKIKEEVIHECPTCGHKSVSEMAQYAIPEGKGHLIKKE